MKLENEGSGPVLVDVLDRVLDKGIVIDAAVRVAVVGIELLSVDARVVVASIETYLRHADALAHTTFAAASPRVQRQTPALFIERVATVTEAMPADTGPMLAEPAPTSSEAAPTRNETTAPAPAAEPAPQDGPKPLGDA